MRHVLKSIHPRTVIFRITSSQKSTSATKLHIRILCDYEAKRSFRRSLQRGSKTAGHRAGQRLTDGTVNGGAEAETFRLRPS